jgi:hypothetical protein
MPGSYAGEKVSDDFSLPVSQPSPGPRPVSQPATPNGIRRRRLGSFLQLAAGERFAPVSRAPQRKGLKDGRTGDHGFPSGPRADAAAVSGSWSCSESKERSKPKTGKSN